MKKLFTRIVSFALIVALFCTFLPLSSFADYYPPVDSDYFSIVDALKSIGVDSSFSNRELIANENGIYDYQGTAEQNIFLLDLLKSGQLVIPGTSSSTTYDEHATPGYEDTWDSEPDYYFEPETPAICLGYAEPAQTMVEAIECTTLRTEPCKASTAICKIVPGDCFTLDGSPVMNEYGNVWYAVKYGGTTAYIYSERVEQHSHFFTRIGSSDISICKCGVCSTADVYASSINAGALALDPFIVGDPEALTAAVTVLGAAGSAVLVAAPYAVLVVASGALIYLVVTSSGAQVLESYELKTAEDCERRFREDGSGVYYKAATIKGSGALLLGIAESDQMDVKEANDYLKRIVNSQIFPAFTTELTQSSFLSVWTYSQGQAVTLCERFIRNGPNYGYGDSTTYKCTYDGDTASAYEPVPNTTGNYAARYIGYYQHYHLWYNGLSFFKKTDNTHVFFGLPITNGSAA